MGAVQLIARKNLQNTRVLRIFHAKILTEGQEPLPAFVNWPRKRKETNRICKQRSRALHKYILEGWLPRETGNGELHNKQKGLPNKFADFFSGNYDEQYWNLQDFTIFLNPKVGQKNSLVITPQLFRKYKKASLTSLSCRVVSYRIVRSSWVFWSFPAFAIKLSGINASFDRWDNNKITPFIFVRVIWSFSSMLCSWILISELVVSQMALSISFPRKQQLSEWFVFSSKSQR